RQLAFRTAPGGTLSTYAAAGHVRRGLATAGFEVKRVAGFGDKAEMITARYDSRQRLRDQRQKPARVVIVGAGLAGLFCAKALAFRQVPVTVLESADEPLQGSSAVRQMAVYPQLALKPTAWNLFSIAAFQHLRAMEPAMNATGFHMLITREAQRERLARIADIFPNDFLEYGDAAQLSNAIGLPVTLPGMMYHTAGWLDLEQTFGPLLELLPIHTGTRVQEINRSDNGWELRNSDDETIVEASHVIIASGAGSIPMLHSLPLTPVRGQSLRLRLPEHYQPHRLLSGPVTLFPPVKGLCTLSATYEHGSRDTDVRESDTMELLGRLKELFPDLTCEVVSETVGLRNVPRDRVPVVGP
ncbi:MAG: FAD-dependent oxidoreductase, partial [Pseudomonadales bacterium]|nr:FAD-dependent oxidoreductase [Pseudomonadales bacterium]